MVEARANRSGTMVAAIVIGAIVLLGILFILCFGFLLFYFIGGAGQPSPSSTPFPVEGPGLSSDYHYSKAHEVRGSQDGSLADYQIKFIVHRGNGTDGGADVFLDGGSRNWPYDVRFTDASGGRLSYWIESFDADASTVWVKINGIPASPGSAWIRVYYGRDNDNDESNGDGTFVFFDDFGGTNLNDDKWYHGSSGDSYFYKVNNGELYLSGGPGTLFCIGSRTKVGPYGHAFEIRAKSSDTSGVGIGADNRSSGGGTVTFAKVYNDGAGRLYANYNNGVFTTRDRITSYSDFQRLSILWSRPGVTYLESGIPRAYITTDVPASAMGLCFCVNGGGNIAVDWCAIRKYAPDEPSHGAWA